MLIVVISVALAPPIGGLAAARALRELLGEIDDIARATLGSVTIATMLKLVDRQRNSNRGSGTDHAAALTRASRDSSPWAPIPG